MKKFFKIAFLACSLFIMTSKVIYADAEIFEKGFFDLYRQSTASYDQFESEKQFYYVRQTVEFLEQWLKDDPTIFAKCSQETAETIISFIKNKQGDLDQDTALRILFLYDKSHTVSKANLFYLSPDFLKLAKINTLTLDKNLTFSGDKVPEKLRNLLLGVQDTLTHIRDFTRPGVNAQKEMIAIFAQMTTLTNLDLSSRKDDKPYSNALPSLTTGTLYEPQTFMEQLFESFNLGGFRIFAAPVCA